MDVWNDQATVGSKEEDVACPEPDSGLFSLAQQLGKRGCHPGRWAPVGVGARGQGPWGGTALFPQSHPACCCDTPPALPQSHPTCCHDIPPPPPRLQALAC